MFFESYNIILYSNINKLFTLSITGGSKGTQRVGIIKNLNIYFLLFQIGWMVFYSSTYIKARTIILLSREEISSRKTLQAGRASFTSCSSDSSFALRVRGIPVAFIYRKKCICTLRSLNYRSGWLQGDIHFTSVTEMVSVMKEFFGPRVIKADYN